MIKKKVLLRVDGNSQIGLGHIYRCIAIAEMLKEDFECEFLLSSQSISNKIIPKEFSIKIIPPNYSFEFEDKWIAENYNKHSVLIILDGYQFNSDYQKKIKASGIKSIYIDDLAKEYIYANAVINHSPSAKEKDYQKENDTKLFLGTDYAMLRQGFLQKAKLPYSTYQPIHSVLISMGGSDENNITLKIVEALLPIKQIQKINIVLGAAYQYKNTLQQLLVTSKKNSQLFSNLPEKEIIELMQLSDAAIAPCSTTCLELFAINKPVFAGFSASNQINLYTYFSENNLIVDLKNLQTITIKEIQDIVESNIEHRNEINKMLILQRQLINGYSTTKIKEIVSNLFHES